jgi:hypothetical protein
MAVKRRGRKTILTPELQDKILFYVSKGSWLDNAAACCGVDRVTVHRWIKRGRHEQEGLYHDFAVAFDQAEAKVVAVAEQSILIAGTVGVAETKQIVRKKNGETVEETVTTSRTPNIEACMYFLEKRHPEVYGNRS